MSLLPSYAWVVHALLTCEPYCHGRLQTCKESSCSNVREHLFKDVVTKAGESVLLSDVQLLACLSSRADESNLMRYANIE